MKIYFEDKLNHLGMSDDLDAFIAIRTAYFKGIIEEYSMLA